MVFFCDCDDVVMDLRLMIPYDIRSDGVTVVHLCLSFLCLMSVCSNPFACDDVVSNYRVQCFFKQYAW